MFVKKYTRTFYLAKECFVLEKDLIFHYNFRLVTTENMMVLICEYEDILMW